MNKRTVFLAAVVLMLFACSGSNDDGNNNSNTCSIGTESNSLLFSFTSDYATGELRWMSPDSAKYSPGALSFGQDSYVSAAGDDLFVLTRYPGILSCVKARDICDKKAMKQVKLDGENPYEVAIIGDKGYMVLWDTHYIQVFNPGTCTPTGKIPLPELPPLQDGNSSIASRNPASIKASGDTLLITMQRLEWDNLGMSPKTPNGLLVRINATAKTTIDTIPLKLYNPGIFGSTVLSRGKLYIPQNGLWDPGMNLLDNSRAGLEVVDLATGETEVLVTGTELGGGVQTIALDEENQILYMLVYREWRDAPVIPFDLVTKKAGEPLPGIIDGFGGLKFDDVGKKLFVGEREFNRFGLKIYNPATNETVMVRDDGKWPLPPYSQAIARW
ncbi:MAG: hypothetical protein LBQ87_10075 [Candidatus Fibromonas sp.]|jgi:hypothetical protein|nr:hypothetical protein [Candidatus Fibromonas sp.]